MNTDKFVLITPNGATADLTAVPSYDAGNKTAAATEAAESWAQITWRRFCRNKVALGSLMAFLAILVTAILAPLLAPFDPNHCTRNPCWPPRGMDFMCSVKSPLH